MVPPSSSASTPFLVVGTGAREHAIAWRLREDGRPVFLHPGNAGTREDGFEGFEVDLPEDDAGAIAARCRDKGVGCVVVGPERLLATGFADKLRALGLSVVGPGRIAAQLESSKIFAKKFLVDAKVPSAGFRTAANAEQLRDAVGSTFPVVLKYDGLAAGKGVVVATGAHDVDAFADRVWTKFEFGKTPGDVLVEEFLPGREVSYIGFCDGHTFVALPSASDYKRLLDGDKGPNTGGMGAVSPSPWISDTLEKQIRERVIEPVLAELGRKGLEYRGILYAGLMIAADGTPNVLEFNCRFGDPETQATLLRFERGFAECLLATAAGKLNAVAAPTFVAESSCYVVAAAEGYPVAPRSGDAIEGVDAARTNGSQVFFAGASQQDGKLYTAGGRVLGVGACGRDLLTARSRAYEALEAICWPGMQSRRDIGIVKGS